MGFVHHEEAAVLLFQGHESGHVGNVAVHAVYALDDDQHLGKMRAVDLQNVFQRFGIVVGEGLGNGPAQTAALLDGVVGQRVVNDQVAPAAEIAHHRHVGGMPAYADQRILGVLPVGDFPLQFLIQAFFACQQAAAAGAGAVPVDGGLGGLLDLLAAAHAHIVVAAEVEYLLPGHQAGVLQRRIVADEVGVAVAGGVQSLLPSGEDLIFRRVLETSDGRDRPVFVRLILRHAVQVIPDHPGQIVHRGTLAVFLGGEHHAKLLLHLEGNRQYLQAVAAQIVDEMLVVAETAFLYVQRFGVEPADGAADLAVLVGCAAVRGFLLFILRLRRAAQGQLPAGQPVLGDQVPKGDALHLDAVDHGQIVRGDQHPGQPLHGGQFSVALGHLAPQGFHGLCVVIAAAHAHHQRNILVMLIPAGLLQAQHRVLTHVFQPGEGLFQLVRVYVFAGFIDDDFLAAALHKHPVAPLQPDDVAGGIPAALQRVRGKHLPLVKPACVDGLAANEHLAPADAAGFRLLQAVLHAAQRLAHGTADPLFQALAHFHTGDGGFRHAEAADGVIAQRVEQLQLFLRRVASAQDDALDLRAQQVFRYAAEEDLLREPQARFRRDTLQIQAEIFGRGEPCPLQAALSGYLFAQRGAEIVGQKRNGHDQLRLEAAGGFQNGLGRAVPQVDGGIPQKAAPEQIDHEAQHVMEGEERQRTAVFLLHDAAIFLIDQLGIEHLFGDGLAVVDENFALTGGAAGTQGHAAAEGAAAKAILRFGGRLLRQRGKVQRFHVFRKAAPPLGDERMTIGLLQKPQGRFVGACRVDQKGVVTGEDHAPEQGKPFPAGIHRNGDIAFSGEGTA